MNWLRSNKVLVGGVLLIAGAICAFLLAAIYPELALLAGLVSVVGLSLVFSGKTHSRISDS